MNINKIGKFSLVAMAIAVMTACSSVGSDVATDSQTVAVTPAQETNAQYEAEQAALAKNVYYFDFDQATISAEDRAVLAVRAFIMARSPNTTIRLEGHASEEGTREYNITLGERRANAVAMFLMANGVARSQIEVVSYGEERPAVMGSTEEALSKNRRVEIK
jgi:peptidoglycan-associated lipoprotein